MSERRPVLRVFICVVGIPGMSEGMIYSLLLLPPYPQVRWRKTVWAAPDFCPLCISVGTDSYFIWFHGSDLLCVAQNAASFFVAARNASASTTVSQHVHQNSASFGPLLNNDRPSCSYRTWKMFSLTLSPKNRTGSKTLNNNMAKTTLARLLLTWWVGVQMGLMCRRLRHKRGGSASWQLRLIFK